MRSYDLSNIHVLVLEKHRLVRQVMKDVFKTFGVPRIETTDCPMDAFDRFQTNEHDIVLTDWTYDLDGIGFLERLRKSDETNNPYVPVIVVTANTEVRHVCLARDGGMTEYLAKPISASLIYSRICSVIENHRKFVRTSDFFGPDRRRQQRPFCGQDRRKLHMY